MPTIRTAQTVMAVCDEVNLYQSALTVDEIKKAVAEEDGIEISEVTDSDVLDWLSDNAEWVEGEVQADEITYRNDDTIQLSEDD